MIRAARRLAALALVAAIAPTLAPAAAWAEPARAVVELFTSQGCSSSPPADRVLAGLARDPGLIVLSLPVDYWDYLGWKDTLAQSGFSARQRAYALTRGDRMVFTPQAVVNGGTALVGSDRAALARSVAGAVLPVAVDVRESGATVTLDVGAGAGGAGSVWLVPVARESRVSVERGENRGQSLTYVNVARAMVRVGAWSGQASHYEVSRAIARPDGADAYVVLLQADRGAAGRILGAAKGPTF